MTAVTAAPLVTSVQQTARRKYSLLWNCGNSSATAAWRCKGETPSREAESLRQVFPTCSLSKVFSPGHSIPLWPHNFLQKLCAGTSASPTTWSSKDTTFSRQKWGGSQAKLYAFFQNSLGNQSGSKSRSRELLDTFCITPQEMKANYMHFYIKGTVA